MIGRPTTRDVDEKILAMLALSQRGLHLSDIEARLGLPKGTASIARKRILLDDLKHSGEQPDLIRAAYDRPQAKRRY